MRKTLSIAAALVAVYVVAYYVDMEIWNMPAPVGANLNYTVVPRYRVGGEYAETLFGPAYRIDRNYIRTTAWGGRLDSRPVSDAFADD